MFSSFSSCSQMLVVFYHEAVQGFYYSLDSSIGLRCTHPVDIDSLDSRDSQFKRIQLTNVSHPFLLKKKYFQQ